MHLSASSALAALLVVTGSFASAQDLVASSTPSEVVSAPAPSDSAASGPRNRNGTVETFTLPSCNGAIRLGKKHRWSMGPDSCLPVSTSSSFRIEEPAICPNGTRARLARFEGRECSGDLRIAEDSIVDILDRDIGSPKNGKCFSIQPDSMMGKGGSHASFSFFCEGRATKAPSSGNNENNDGPFAQEKKGSVSHNICPVRGDSRMRAPTFRHPRPDTCMSLPAGQPLKVLSVAVCPDGRDAQLARWKGRDCPGHEPSGRGPLADEELDSCMLWDEGVDTSYAFWCTGETKRGELIGEPGEEDGRRERSGSSIIGLILVLFLIGSLGILVFAFALLRWAAVASRVMNVVRCDGSISL